MWGWLFCIAAAAVFSSTESAGAGAARLVCYVESERATEDFSECTHLVYAGDARGNKLDGLLKEYRKHNPRLKIILRVSEVDKDLRTLLKSKHVQGLEIYDAHKTLNKTKVLEKVEEAKTAISSSGGGPLLVALPTHPELLAKYYDLRTLVKKADLMMVQTHALGHMKKTTYHPSRLSGLWDMMNTDSVVDLVIGLGVPASKIVISLPATVRQFTLLNETLSTPGSPTMEDEPKEVGQAELCRQLQKGRWTLERDQDLSAPYAFKDKTWMSFEDASSVDVKGKYARVRGLAGLALHRAELDVETRCGPTLKASLAKVLNQQSRAPRAAVLRSLEHEILSAPGHARALDALQVSPYRITQVVDSDGVIHSIREDTRTEFSCSRQGYFVHPRSCARFYRCVKFDQLSPEYTVFEFDCPTGLAFDARYEVCVWPGSLPHSQACPGSSEIAPVPQTRFICPEHEGFYVDPENCRWFFACLDHGKAPLTAYEFRCPFGLGFDAEKLKCDWPWVVPACGNIARYEAEAYGYSAATLTGAAGYQGQTADAINVAAHQSLVSGAALDNLVGIQGGFLTNADALDTNFIASQELDNTNSRGQYYEISNGGSYAHVHGGEGNGLSYQNGGVALRDNLGGVGLVQPSKYNDEEKYTSGSIILDDYRLPTSGRNHGKAQSISISQDQGTAAQFGQDFGHIVGISHGQATDAGIGFDVSHNVGIIHGQAKASGTGLGVNKKLVVNHSQATVAGNRVNEKQSGQYTKSYNGFSKSTFTLGSSAQKNIQYQSGSYEDNSGAYVHDPSGDYAVPYKHVDSPAAPYNHDASGYKQSTDYNDNGKYSGASQSSYEGKYAEGVNVEGKYVDNNDGQYIHDNSGAYVESISGSSGYRSDYFGSSGYKAGYSGSSGSGYQTDYSGSSSSGYKAGYSGSSGTAYKSGYSGASSADYSGSYTADNSGSYIHDNSGQYEAGVYRTGGHIGSYNEGFNKGGANGQYHGSYSEANTGNYLSDSKAYTGASHTLTAGAVNVGLVGKTTLVDVDYSDRNNYHGLNTQTSFGHQSSHPAHVSFVSQPAVSINHIGTDGNNIDGYSFVTTPTSSGVPTTATPFAVTTSLPTVSTFKTTFVPEAPKSSIKQIFGYSQPAVTFVQPTVIPIKQYVTPKLHVINHNQGLNYQYESKDYTSGYDSGIVKTAKTDTSGYDYSSDFNGGITSPSGASKSESTGYDYSKPSVKFEEGIRYTTAAPVVVTTYKPQGFGNSHQTIHKVESVGFQHSTPTPVTEEPFKKLVAYTTGPSVSYAQPTVLTYKPQASSHQTIHKVETSNYSPSVETATGFESGITYQEPKLVQYTAQPAVAFQPVVSTYEPQAFSHQTLHKVDAGRVNYSKQNSGSYSQETSGYSYEKPAIQFENAKTVVQYSTPAPAVVSTFGPQAYSQQTIHKVENNIIPISSTSFPKAHISYESPVTVYSNPILKYTENVTPATYVQPTYKSQAFSHQTIHKIGDTKAYTPAINVGSVGYEYTKSVNFQEPKTVYTTAQPAVSTYHPQVFSHETQHDVDAGQVNTYSDTESAYSYGKPAINIEEPKSGVEYSTPVSAVVSTYRPQAYSHQTIHKVETQKVGPLSSTPLPDVEYTYKQADVSTYENPILKYTQNVAPVTYVNPTAAVFAQTYQPIVQQHQVSHLLSQPIQYEAKQSYAEQNLQVSQEGYSYSQPEIQRNIETSNTAKAYSDASVVSHQTFHLSNGKSDYESGKEVFVSKVPSTLAFEDQYADYESQKKVESYKTPELILPKSEYQQSYAYSTASTPIAHQGSIFHQTQDEYDYKPIEHLQQYDTVHEIAPVKQVSFSTSHISEPKKIESIHFSSFPARTASTNYKQTTYESPEIQVGSKAEEYLPPVVSTVTPVVSSTYRPRTYSAVSTTRKYLPPAAIETYLAPSTTDSAFVKSTSPAYKIVESTIPYKATEYLPPVESNGANVVNFESFDNIEVKDENTYQDYSVPKDIPVVVTQTSAPIQRKQNIVVETAKSHLLGFGTVGSDAGLVSPVTYTTGAPILVSSTYRPNVKSSTQEPSYRYFQSTTEYNAPEYLPPSEQEESDVNLESFGFKSSDVSAETIKYNPYQGSVVVSTSAPKRKQNIVVETAKSQLLGIGNVEPELISPVTYTTAAPIVLSSTNSYSLSPKIVTSTYAPIEQGLFEVTPSPVPIRRTKPKVAVVTKVNDFNPLLVRKLGAVCSCQSPVLILKGKRPNSIAQSFDDYSDNDNSNYGDNNDNQWAQKSVRIQNPTVTATPIVTSTFNPIIVPDDSFYQDYQEPSNYEVNVTPKEQVYSERIVASTPAISTTENVIRIRPRIRPVTVAPTYRTVLLNQEVSPTALESEAVITGSQAFDRYGPGGWRSRDETLQGSVDCKRAGLFRHPKQCNKFYACRWDCTKQRFTLHVFNCPIQLSFDPSIGACNWPSQGPACQGDTLLTNAL